MAQSELTYVYLTGASGFLGQHLKKTLPKKYRLIKITRKCTKLKYKIKKPNAILVHLGENSSTKKCEKRFRLQKKYLKYLNINQFRKVIYASSYYVYKPQSRLKIKEVGKTNKLFEYALSKIKTEILIQKHQNYIILRFSNILGLNMKKSTAIAEIIKAHKNGETAKLQNPNITRDFLWIDDAISALWKAIKSGKNGIYNIGSGFGVNLKKLQQYLATKKAHQDSSNISLDYFCKNRLVLNIQKGFHDLLWAPKTSFFQSLHKLGVI